MSLASSFELTKAWILKTYGKDPAKMLLHTGAWGWILSSAAQITGVAINDKISSDEKKFLIPQEIADAAINILSFYTVTKYATKLGEKLVTTGKIINRPVRNFVEKFLEAGKKKIKLGDLKTKPMSELIENSLETVKSKVKLGNFSTNIENIVKNDVNIKRSYYSTKTWAKVIASTLGAVVSSNFITPVIRNHIGAKVQKNSLQQSQQFKNLLLTTQNRLGIEDYKKQATMKANYQPAGSGLKI